MIDLSQTASPFEVAYTIGALFDGLLFLVLLIFAIRDAWIIRVLPRTHPDMMIAADGIINESIRLVLLAGGMLAIGLAAIVTPPAREANPTAPSIEGVTLFVVLVAWQVGLALWAIKDLLFRRRLYKQLSRVRVVCSGTTFQHCPFINRPLNPPTLTPEEVVGSPPITPEEATHDESR